MLYFEDKNEKPDSMIKLLIDQCDHLEELMSLVRKQIEALSRRDADAISNIVSQRDEINRKLEMSQQQIDRKMS
jgi:flagellar biosynthesis/type III secretory pathway chaperone